MTSIGFVLAHEQFPAPELLELGQAAESAGFPAVWTSDHFHPWMDNEGHAGQAWVTLAALGQRTQNVRMGTGVTCPTFRYHPAIVAQAFASLGVLYPGRVFLGVGAGEAVNEEASTGQWAPYEERAERLEEAIDVIRQLWSGAWVNHHGTHYQVENAHLYDLPKQPVPIYMAGEGPKSAELAGRCSDGLISDAETILEPEFRQAFERGARAAGKDPAAMPKLAELMVVVGGRDEGRYAAEKWRFQPKSWSKYVDVPDPREINAEADREIPLDQVMKKLLVSDDPQQHASKLRDLFSKGVTDVYVHAGQQDQRRVIDFYGKQVLPLVH